MIGADPRAFGQVAAGNLQDLISAFQDLILRHSKELALALKPLSRGRTAPLTIARIDVGNDRYCLIQYEKEDGKNLSRQQMKVALLVMEGLSNKDIGRRLGIRPGTVASHLAQIYSKLNIGNRAALAGKCIQLGHASIP